MPSNVEVAVTGTDWLGAGLRSIDTALRELLEGAQDEVMLTAYSIGPQEDRIFKLIEASLARGVRITFVVNRLTSQPPTATQRLRALASTFGHFHLIDYCPDDATGDLHAKVVVVDRRSALVGSSNLSFRGFVTNHEIAVIMSGPEAAQVGMAIDRLLASSACSVVST